MKDVASIHQPRRVWELRHAANIIEKCAAVVPEVADEVLAKLTAASLKPISFD
ncbi:hypothetical protein [Ostreiculturibacter nitratireducens]|uniref:hypothetical protein n=1 Tax=Ostreiculturibacter nitratireducens TaxID=3075226 RepID=UPI0031B5DDE9